MTRFQAPSRRPERQQQQIILQRKHYRYCVRGAIACILVSLILHSFLLSQSLYNIERSKEERSLYNQESIEKREKNNISSMYGRKPRIVPISSLPHEPLKFEFAESSIPTSGHFIQPSWYTPNGQDLLWDAERCEVQYPWQLSSFQNCNKFHELDMTKLKVINSGGSRTAFELKQQLDDGMEYKFVYKSMKYYSEVDFYKIEEQRKDALVMERAKSSEFIPDIHGYCQNGVIMDFMPEGNMHEYIKGARIAKKKGKDGLSPVDRLRVSIHIASSVRDLHETGDDKDIAAFYHNDICCHQYLFQNGIFKLNDFNYARPMTFMKNNATEKALCLRDYTNMGYWKGRSFEEHLAQAKDARLEPFSGDKTDVNMMGNLMYLILTDLYLFEHPKLLTRSEAAKAWVAGKRSPYPDEIENSNNPAHIAVKKAIDMCWEEKWSDRPSARIITDYLMRQLQTITNEETPDLRVTLPKRDPDQRPTDSDYRENTYN